MPAPIDKIRLRNFKGFYTGAEEEVIELGSNHLLLYGENGSGKSSIYWALYTLFQSATKEPEEIEKYFDPTREEQLINHEFLKEQPTFAVEAANGRIVQPQSVGNNSYVQIDLADKESARISGQGVSFGQLNEQGHQQPGTGNEQILEDFNKRSDFISHRLLINFYNFRNSKQINLWEVFVRDIFPFLLTEEEDVNLGQLLKEIETEKPFYKFSGTSFKLRRRGGFPRKSYEAKITKLNEEINNWIGEINGLVNSFYNNHFRELGEGEMSISLEYAQELAFDDIFQETTHENHLFYMWDKKHVDLNQPVIAIRIKHKDQNNNWVLVERPQSYFNEAKLTQIALSVRFSLLDESIRTADEGKVLALDDLLISLDMANRNKVVDIILDEFANNYKILLLTHERNFYDFVVFKIKQRSKTGDWHLKEIHAPDKEKKSPILIDSGLDYYEKAKKYFEAKDYTTCSIYLRKHIEKLVVERIPDEFTKTVDGQFKHLSTYWKILKDRYAILGNPITAEVNDLFEQSKLLIFNPQAHFRELELPVYRVELEKAMVLVDKINSDYPIPSIKLLLAKGMTLEFVHPTENYRLQCDIKTDLSVNTLNGTVAPTDPNCNVTYWEYNGGPYWDFHANATNKREMTLRLSRLFDVLINHTPLAITKPMILENTKIKGGLWTLKELADKAGITL